MQEHLQAAQCGLLASFLPISGLEDKNENYHSGSLLQCVLTLCLFVI